MSTASSHEPEIHKLFRVVMRYRASGLYLRAGLPPWVKMNGVTREMELAPLSSQGIETLILPVLSIEQRERLDRGEEVKFTYPFENQRFLLFMSNNGGDIRFSARWLELT